MICSVRRSHLLTVKSFFFSLSLLQFFFDTTFSFNSGDFYVTRHSNLAQVHVVFHLVTDDTVGKTNITSRHPIIIGLRNVLLSAATHNITTLTIPLLMVHELTEVSFYFPLFIRGFFRKPCSSHASSSPDIRSQFGFMYCNRSFFVFMLWFPTGQISHPVGTFHTVLLSS